MVPPSLHMDVYVLLQEQLDDHLVIAIQCHLECIAIVSLCMDIRILLQEQLDDCL